MGAQSVGHVLRAGRLRMMGMGIKQQMVHVNDSHLSLCSCHSAASPASDGAQNRSVMANGEVRWPLCHI